MLQCSTTRTCSVLRIFVTLETTRLQHGTRSTSYIDPFNHLIVAPSQGTSSDIHKIVSERYITTANQLPTSLVYIAKGRSRKQSRLCKRGASEQGSSKQERDCGSDDHSSVQHHVRLISNVKQTISQEQSKNVEYGLDNPAPLPYPRGRPWRVLWPRPHGTFQSQPVIKRIPTVQDFQRAWTMYKQTWEDGLSGRPSSAKLQRQAQQQQQEELSKQISTSKSQQYNDENKEGSVVLQKVHDIGENAAHNIRLIRQDAQTLLNEAKERTGIRTQEDLKGLASDMMQIATECIQEFLAGYRQGRDQEIDRMLNQYFQQEQPIDNEAEKDTEKHPLKDPVDSPANNILPQKKRRKPKRGIPRD